MKGANYIQKIYKDESITLIQGDCLAVMDELIKQGVKVDCIITDPPYGVTACSWDSIIPLEDMWKCINSISHDKTPIVLFGNEPFSSTLRCSNLKQYKYKWTWIKNQATNHLHAKHMPMRKTEDINIFFKKSSWYNPQKSEGHIPTNSAKGCSNGVIYHGTNIRNYEGGDTTRMPVDILYFNCVDNYSKVHPNEKPVDLLEYLISTYTNEWDLILDFTCGSGSTLIAAKNTNRKCIGIELDTKYCEIAKNRIENHTICSA